MVVRQMTLATTEHNVTTTEVRVGVGILDRYRYQYLGSKLTLKNLKKSTFNAENFLRRLSSAVISAQLTLKKCRSLKSRKIY